MTATAISIAGYGAGPASASPVWIASYGGPPPASVTASEAQIAGYGGLPSSATAVRIIGYGPAVPAGATAMWISGTQTGAGTAPSSIWSAADATAGSLTLSNGGLTFTPTGATLWRSIRGSISKSSGQLYVEFALGNVSASQLNLWGFANAGFPPANQLGLANYSCAVYDASIAFVSSGFTSNYLLSFMIQPNDVISLAIDFTAGKIWIARNGTWLGTGANPATGTAPVISFVPATVGALFPAMSVDDTTDGPWTLQATAASQKYAPPSGFTPWG